MPRPTHSASLVFAALAVLALAAAADPARAQCGAGTSECRACHEGRGAKPVEADGAPWHHDHAVADFCAVCHGGNPDAKDEASAHAGLFAPLERVDAACGSCHGADAQALAQRYRSASASRSSAPRAVVSIPPAPGSPPRIVWGNVVLAVVVAAVGLGGGSLVVRHERRLRGGPP